MLSHAAQVYGDSLKRELVSIIVPDPDEAAEILRRGTDGVSTDGVTANFMFFDRGTFWVPVCQNLSSLIFISTGTDWRLPSVHGVSDPFDRVLRSWSSQLQGCASRTFDRVSELNRTRSMSVGSLFTPYSAGPSIV